MDWQRLETEAIDLFRVVAPCLMRTTAVRFVDMRDLPGVGLAYANGFVQVNLDIIAARAIDNPPSGRFIAIAFNGERFAAMPDAERLYAFIAVALHELSHVIELDYPGIQRRRPYTPATVAEDAAAIVASHRTPRAAMHEGERRLDDRQLLWMHGDRFIRAALHLLHRARVADPRWRNVGLAEVAGKVDGRAEPWQYRNALGSEPAELIGIPLSEILDMPAPAAFTALWEADCQASEVRRMNEPPIFVQGDRVMSFFETLKSLITTKRRQQAIDFAGLARMVAENQHVRPEDAAAILEASNRTPDELQDAVERLKTRRGQRQRLSQIREAIAARPAIEREIAEADQRFQAAQREYAATLEPLRKRLDGLSNMAAEIGNIERSLRTSAPAELVQKANDLESRQLFALKQRREELVERAHAGDLRVEVESKLVAKMPAFEETKIARAKNFIAGVHADAKACRAEIDSIDEQIAALDAELRETSLAMIEA